MPGDPDLIQTLHREHAAALERYVVRLVGDRQRAADVVQETMLRAWLHDLSDDGRGSVRAWLYTVARHLVVDETRSSRARHEVAAAEPPDTIQPDRVDSLFDALLVSDALAQLSSEHRAVVVRAYYLRQSIAEIAEALEIPPGTVKSRLHYGLRALRLALQERGVTR
ncbi:MAG TPA: sigma-70 family RNA polymerase sigma factor [Pseudonocardia sp.]|jgi:RNA polymerase sigma-70 factor (ECF subfamily)